MAVELFEILASQGDPGAYGYEAIAEIHSMAWEKRRGLLTVARVSSRQILVTGGYLGQCREEIPGLMLPDGESVHLSGFELGRTYHVARGQEELGGPLEVLENAGFPGDPFLAETDPKKED